MSFLLIDRILTFDLGRRATGVKTIAPDEAYFRDHFPGYPIVPGVLLVESLAQLGGRLIAATVRSRTNEERLPVLAMIQEAKFRRPVRPDDRLDLHVEITSLAEAAARVTGVATVGGQQAATAVITYFLVNPEDAGVTPEDLERLKIWSDQTWQQLTDI